MCVWPTRWVVFQDLIFSSWLSVTSLYSWSLRDHAVWKYINYLPAMWASGYFLCPVLASRGKRDPPGVVWGCHCLMWLWSCVETLGALCWYTAFGPCYVFWGSERGSIFPERGLRQEIDVCPHFSSLIPCDLVSCQERIPRRSHEVFHIQAFIWT